MCTQYTQERSNTAKWQKASFMHQDTEQAEPHLQIKAGVTGLSEHLLKGS